MSLSTINDNRDVKTATPEGKAFRVDVVNQPIAVNYGERGDVTFLHEDLNITSKNTATILTLIVPAGKIVELENVQASGDGFALYEVQINSNTMFRKRTYYTEYNAEFDLGNYKLIASDDIKVIITNRSGESCDYDTTLTYRIYDA